AASIASASARGNVIIIRASVRSRDDAIYENSNWRENSMARKLQGKKVAILVANGFEQVEMTKPREALDEAGAKTKIISLKSAQIQGMQHAEKGEKFDVERSV